ncbi:diguanylate cyclase [Fusibacter paucivorans]|uniref:Diguanylate cyclase n=1 Tax=Fusibacter paucivorans TaxID=76009 RepID=A0ABS5PKS6_9FIRM|nr:diguanylate cyclase [Fusibacter paucivorans]MBS7525718.1 diguanylate cyclase [Fusibacter paucivorans]
MISVDIDLEKLNDLMEANQQISHAEKIEAVENRINTIRELDDVYLKVRTLINYGKELYAVGKNEAAREIASEMYQVSSKESFDELHMLCCNLLGNISARKGFYAMALDYYHQSLQVIETHALRTHYRSMLINNIASLYASLKLYDSAVKYYLDALPLAAQEGNYEAQFLIYYNLGDIYARQRQAEQLAETEQMLMQMTQSTCQGTFYLGLYKLLAAKHARINGDIYIAQALLASVLTLLAVEEDPVTRLECYIEKALCAYADKQYEIALHEAKIALTQVVEAEEFEFEREVLQMLCDIATAMGNTAITAAYQKQLITLDETFIARMNEMTIFQIREKSAVKIENRLNENAVKLLKNMQMIYEISQEITKEQDYDKIFRLIIQKLVSFMDFDALVIGLYNAENQVVYNRMMYHRQTITRSYDVSVHNKSSLATWCIRHSQEIYTGFNSHLKLDDFEPLQLNFPDLEVPYESVFYLPLYDEGTIIGVFSLQKFERDGFNHYELEMIRTIGAYIAIAITNALKTQELKRLNGALEALSRRDSLSGLANRHALNEDLKTYFAPSMRQNHISVIMIDIDFFKEFNDRYGHLEGDMVIRKTAEIIHRHIDDLDARAYRYGGDEFLILARAVPLEIIEIVCEMILRDIRMLSIRHDDSNINGIVTLSIGIASYGNAYLEAGEDVLLKGADNAVYEAKGNGRNGIAHIVYDVPKEKH